MSTTPTPASRIDQTGPVAAPDEAAGAALAPGHETAETSASFTNGLRARAGTVEIAGADRITVRVQVPEVWDAVRVTLPRAEPALALKVRALDALYPDADFHEEFVLKLEGWEVLDEHASVADAGAVDGSIFLLTHRRRRPVR